MTAEERRQREIDMRRENAIIVASKLFHNKRYENVSMEEIAIESELGETTLYKYFEDKESIFFAVVNRGTEIFSSIIVEEEERMPTTNAKFGLLKASSKRFFFEYPDYAYSYLIFRSGIYKVSNDGNMKYEAKEINEFTQKYFEMGLSEIKTGTESGIYRSDINPVIIFALNILIQDSIMTMSSDLRKMLNDYGISTIDFYKETDDFTRRMFSITEGRK